MPLEVRPTVPESHVALIERALARAGIRADGRPALYDSAWRRAGAREAVDNEPATARYARSPRSIRGATRA